MKNLLLLVFILLCIFFSLGFYETILNSGNADRWNKTLKDKDIQILNLHSKNARKHPFGFNDSLYPEKKEEDCFRIIVLGDSVVFGDGLPFEQIWSRKLEKTLKRKYSVEVLHWGQCGWSTLDQLNFLKQNFSDKENIFDADLLLISWFDNDPDMGNINFDFHRKLLSNRFFVVFTWIFPKLGAILYEFNEKQEYHIIREKLYSHENLKRYKEVLNCLKLFCREKKTDLMFVLLSYGVDQETNPHQKIEDLLEKEGIDHFNLNPRISGQVREDSVQTLYASAVNKHPGSILTTLYARYTLSEIVKRYGSKMAEIGRQKKTED